MTLNIAVIGAGRIGKVHAENLVMRVPEAQVVAVADPIGDAAAQLAARWNIPHATQDYQELLRDPAIDAVVICSSTDSHAPISIAAAAAGKHIFCEKPIAFDLALIDEVLAAVEQAGVKFQVGFNRRFDPDFARVQQAIAQGDLGDLHLLHIISRDPAPPPLDYIKVSGGIFLDMMIHDFDMLRFLVNSPVTELYAKAAVRIDERIGEAGDYDTAMVMLSFENGTLATIENSRQAVYGYDQRVEVFGSKGAASLANNFPNQVTFSRAEGVQRDLPLHFFMERYTESYLREIQAFIQAVVEDRPVPVTGIDGRIPVLLGLAAGQSVREGRPIKLR